MCACAAHLHTPHDHGKGEAQLGHHQDHVFGKKVRAFWCISGSACHQPYYFTHQKMLQYIAAVEIKEKVNENRSLLSLSCFLVDATPLFKQYRLQEKIPHFCFVYLLNFFSEDSNTVIAQNKSQLNQE